jgi:hypothetical protein
MGANRRPLAAAVEPTVHLGDRWAERVVRRRVHAAGSSGSGRWTGLRSGFAHPPPFSVGLRLRAPPPHGTSRWEWVVGVRTRRSARLCFPLRGWPARPPFGFVGAVPPRPRSGRRKDGASAVRGGVLPPIASVCGFPLRALGVTPGDAAVPQPAPRVRSWSGPGTAPRAGVPPTRPSGWGCAPRPPQIVAERGTDAPERDSQVLRRETPFEAERKALAILQRRVSRATGASSYSDATNRSSRLRTRPA